MGNEILKKENWSIEEGSTQHWKRICGIEKEGYMVVKKSKKKNAMPR